AGGFGAGAASARAFTSDWKSTFLCVPSQKGLFSEWPQRQSPIEVRPPKSNALPPASYRVNSPSTRSEPLLFTVIFAKCSSKSSGDPASARSPNGGVPIRSGQVPPPLHQTYPTGGPLQCGQATTLREGWREGRNGQEQRLGEPSKQTV